MRDMDIFDEHDRALIEQTERSMEEARMIALEHIPAYPPFSHLPDRVNGRMIAEFARIADTKAVSGPELKAMLETTISGYLDALQNRLLVHPNLGAVRIAVLVHVAMVVGHGSLMDMGTLWSAISGSRWDEGARCLLKSKWPGTASTEAEQDRIVDIADMFRTGMPPRTWTT